MKFLFAVILLLMLGACRKVFYYTSLDPATNPQSVVGKLQLDNTYKFYVRQVFEEKVNNESELKSDVPATARGKEELIEVEYLFISKDSNRVVYITTMADKYKQRYRKFYLGDKYANAWDFKTFLFGELLPGNEIKFTDWKNYKTDTWQIDFSNGNDERVYFTQLTEKRDSIYHQQIPVKEVLKHEVFFTKVNDPMVVFHQNETREDTVQLLNNTIYLLKRRGRHRLYLQFNGKVNDKRSTIYFGEGRIVYDPRPFFKP